MEFKPKITSVFVTGEMQKAKRKLGISWKGLIIRGIQSIIKNPEEEKTKDEKIGRMAQKLQEQSVRIFKLENAEQK